MEQQDLPPPLPWEGIERIRQGVKNKEQNGTSVEVGGNMKEILPSLTCNNHRMASHEAAIDQS